MTQILESPLMASLLESDFPEELFLVELDRKPCMHMAVRAENVPGYDVVHGLGCAKTAAEAAQMAAYYGFPGTPVSLTFEQARTLAKSKPDPIAGLLLEDGNGHCIAFHFVK